jgi:plastocyanin
MKAQALLAAGLVLLGAACAQPVGQTSVPAPTPASSATPSAAPAAADSTEVIVKDFTLDPLDVTVSGGTVSLAVTNQGPTVHNVAIRDAAGDLLGTTRDLRTGESEVITPDIAAGSYVLFCSLPGHESLGIKGTLEVSP